MIYAFVFLAIILRIFTNSATNVFQKRLTRDGESPVVINFLVYFILAVLSVPIILCNRTFIFNQEFFIYAVLGGICGAVCNCFMVLALEKGQLSVLGPINSYKAIIGLVFGIIVLKEFPNVYGLTGMLLIIFGTYFILDRPSDFFKKDIMYRFFALIFSAIEAVFIKKVILLSSISISFAVSGILGAMFSFVIYKLFVKNNFSLPEKLSKSDLWNTAICFGVMTFATAFVFRFMNVGYALSLFQISVILNVFLGYKLFKEQNLRKKLAGSVIILIGSTMIILFGH